MNLNHPKISFVEGTKLRASIPDGRLSRSGVHDGMIVIDPFPEAAFGHLLVAFFVDKLDETACVASGGIFLAGNLLMEIKQRAGQLVHD